LYLQRLFPTLETAKARTPGVGFVLSTEKDVKKAILAVAPLGASVGLAYAGQPAEPIIEPTVVIDDTTGSSSGIILPLILLVLVAAAVASS
jgi:hypothetical protein